MTAVIALAKLNLDGVALVVLLQDLIHVPKYVAKVSNLPQLQLIVMIVIL